MMLLRHRFFRDDDDLAAMLALVSASANRDGAQAGHLHQGDVVWGLFQNLTKEPTSVVHLFQDDTWRLRGFVWLFPPDSYAVQVDTTLPDVVPTIREMVGWTESHLAQNQQGDADHAFDVEVASTDQRLKDTLAHLGYRPTGRSDYQLNARGLDSRVDEPRLPAGALVRLVRCDDPADVSARVELHQEVWSPSRFTAEGYARLRTKPVYRPELDLVSVVPDGQLASYCIVWWDPDTETAEFEPVGTASRFRRQGYGKALLLEALRRLHALGARHAIVVSATQPESEPSRQLYASVGFTCVAEFETWRREMRQSR